MTQTDNNRLPYAAPCCEVIEIETAHLMLALSGKGSDSEDSEFGEASERRGVWGDFWE